MSTALSNPARRRWALASALAAGALALSAGPAQAAERTITGGTLDWGVKQSFRNYVENGPAMGEITTANGAERSPDGTFRWPLTAGTYDARAGTGELRSTGTVRFFGHAGALEVAVTDPRVEFGAGGATLYADVRSRGMGDGELKDYPNVDLVTLDAAAVAPVAGNAGVRYDALPSTLTANGSPAFAGFYPAGTAFDPITLDALYGEVQGPAFKTPSKAQKLGRDRTARIATGPSDPRCRGASPTPRACRRSRARCCR